MSAVKDRSNMTHATIGELKTQAIFEHGELIIKIKPGRIHAVMKFDDVIELWHGGNGNIDSNDMQMHRDTWFLAEDYPDWR
jgi:hypothetical protein